MYIILGLAFLLLLTYRVFLRCQHLWAYFGKLLLECISGNALKIMSFNAPIGVNAKINVLQKSKKYCFIPHFWATIEQIKSERQSSLNQFLNHLRNIIGKGGLRMENNNLLEA